MAWPTSFFTGSSVAGNAAAAQPAENNKPGSKLRSSTSSLPEPVADLLKHFEAPGVPPPPSSRVGDPTLKQRESQPIKLWHLWRHAAFMAWKGERDALIVVMRV